MMKMIKWLAILLPSLCWGQTYYNQTDIPPGTITVLTGADPTGVNDSTAAFITFFQKGGILVIPKGDYLIGYAGAAAGGIYATLTKSIDVRCDPGATFHGTNLDHDIINFTVPTAGAGLPSGGVSVVWHGCTFDQTQQKTSTSVPFSSTYPSSNQGTSGNTDGLDITGDYTVSGTLYSGIYYAEVSGATFDGGSHWQNAGTGSGGDSGLGCEAVQLCELHDNTFYGNRDSGIYVSNSTTGTLTNIRTDIYGNYINSSFGGITVKRSTQGLSIHDNTAINTVVGYSLLWIVGNGTAEGEVHGNRCSACQINDKTQYVYDVSIHDEKCDNFGAYLADGVTVPNTYTATGFELEGLTYSYVYNNACTSISTTYAALNPQFITLADYSHGPTGSTNNIIANNSSIGFYQAGEETGAADYNELWENYEWTGSFPYFSKSGSHSSQTDLNRATGIRRFFSPTVFSDGTAGAPMLARYADATTGIYFGTATINFSEGGTERARVTATGLGALQTVVSALGTSAIAVNGSTPTTQTLGTGPGGSSSLDARFSADANGAQNVFLKSRNAAIGSHTTINTGDCIAKNYYYADDGTTFNSEAGEFGVCATGTIGTAQIPGQYVLKLADSAGTLQSVWTNTVAAGSSTPYPIVSTLATGTAPFTIASTTNVANLNASLVTGITSGSAQTAGLIGEVFNINCVVGAAAAAGSAFTFNTSTGVITWTSGFPVTTSGPAHWTCPINFSANGGTLPTGLVAGTTYYIDGATLSGSGFNVSDTAAHALAGTNHASLTGGSGSPLAWIGYLISTGNTVADSGMTLTAGDWMCSGTATSQELTSLTITEFLTGINTSVAIGTMGSYANFQIASNVLGAANSSYVSPVWPENVSGATTTYLISKAAFSGGTQNMGGFLQCWRIG